MSTNTHPPVHAAVVRGSAEFDADALQAQLAALVHQDIADPADTLAYRQFYGLLFPHIDHQHRMEVFEALDQRLVLQVFQPEKTRGHVMLCHGYYDHVGLFASVIEYLLRKGLTVITFDQIGHGLSSGERVVIDSFDTYVAAQKAVTDYALAELSATPEEPLHWVAQSMGGAIVMEYLHHKPALSLGNIILLAPLVRPYAWGFNRWVFALAKLTITSRPRVLTDNAENPEFHDLQAIDPLQARILPVAWVQAMVNWFKRFEHYPESDLAPVIVQGDQDRTVDAEHNLKVFRRRYPHSHHWVIAGGRHHLANESDYIRNKMWRYLDAQCDW
ncbi:MAG: alpha/beta hydrolase [bacterium]